MRRILLAGLALAFCVAAPRPAHAQLGGLSFGVAAGLTTPRGDVKDFKAGPHIQALADLSLPLLPVGFRGEVAYDQLGAPVSGGSAFKVASGVVNATFSLPFPLLHPYAIGGAGYYVHNAGSGGKRQGKVGFNAGLGVELKLPALPRFFAEGRYHTVTYPAEGTAGEAKVKLIPVSIGVIF